MCHVSLWLRVADLLGFTTLAEVLLLPGPPGAWLTFHGLYLRQKAALLSQTLTSVEFASAGAPGHWSARCPMRWHTLQRRVSSRMLSLLLRSLFLYTCVVVFLYHSKSTSEYLWYERAVSPLDFGLKGFNLFHSIGPICVLILLDHLSEPFLRAAVPIFLFL